MQNLANGLKARIKRDECGDWCIVGQRGNIHQDGAGYSIFGTFKSGKGLKHCRDAFLGFCILRQLGDTEAVLHMAALPTPEQAKVIRYFLKIKKIKELSPEQLKTFIEAGAATRKRGQKRAEMLEGHQSAS
jgi:hypothetical protein